jgi:hypothetical protein
VTERGAFEAVTITPFQPRRELLLSSWLKRDLPPRDCLLGNVVCSTSRWLIFGNAGVGKTLFALSMAGAMAAGKSFLGWEGKRCARVIYLDGEMPAETFKERMQLVAEEFGNDLIVRLQSGHSRAGRNAAAQYARRRGMALARNRRSPPRRYTL